MLISQDHSKLSETGCEPEFAEPQNQRVKASTFEARFCRITVTTKKKIDMVQMPLQAMVCSLSSMALAMTMLSNNAQEEDRKKKSNG